MSRFKLRNAGSMPICLSLRYSRYNIADLLAKMQFNIGAEVGVRRGKYSVALCKSNPNLKLYCIDPWFAYTNKYNKERQDRIFGEYREITKGYNIETIRKTSIDALADFKDGSLDFVFIDGNHTFDFVAPDIIYWSCKVREGGIVMVHDCYGWSGAGVLQAVYAYTHCHNLTWFCTKEHEPTAFWVKP